MKSVLETGGAVDQRLRDFFDVRLEQVLAALPQRVLNLLDETPLYVEDYPSPEVLAHLNIKHRSELCGLFRGIAFTNRLTSAPWYDPSTVTIYREGIINISCDEQGRLNEDELLRQIRITVLHEIGHLHGLDEDDLDALGYG